MINLNLMIGDWVQCKGKNICLTAGHLYEVSLDIYKASPYQPIPLTPEILERIEGIKQRVFKDGYTIYGVTINFEDEEDGYWVCIKKSILKITKPITNRSFL